MTDERPLSVRVAEALGWTECEPFEADGIVDRENWCGQAPGPAPEGRLDNHGFIPPFGENSPEGWMATGPLIEMYAIDLSDHRPRNRRGRDGSRGGWVATAWRPNDQPTSVEHGYGPHPLAAVCALILALAEAGKLPR